MQHTHMKFASSLIMGTYLMFRSVPMDLEKAVKAGGTAPTTMASHAFNFTSSDAEDYARFVLETTRASLPEKWRPHAKRIARALVNEASRHGMDPLLLVALIKHESRFNPEARGHHGEIGLMQIKPSTARWVLSRKGRTAAPSEKRLQELLLDPATNIRYGTSYIAHLRKSFKGRRHLYISAYNMGPANVRMHMKDSVQPRLYSDKVLAIYLDLTTGYRALRTAALERTFVRRSAASFN